MAIAKAEKLYNAIGKFGGLYDVFLSLVGYAKSVEYFIQVLAEELSSPQLILDAGCGTGRYSIAALRQFPAARVVAFDQQASMVKRAQKNITQADFQSRARLFMANVTSPLTELSQQFDVILASGVLEYVPVEETIKNLSGFLKPGGYFFHSPVRDNIYGKMVGKLYNFKPLSREKTVAAFTRQGFGLRRVVILPPLIPASFKEAQIYQKKY